MIELINLNKAYGKNTVLENINLKFEPAKIIGIVGANGAGKTTLFKCITGLELYDGEIKHPFDVLKEHIAYLPTHPSYMSRITGREYLQLICNARSVTLPDLASQNIFDLPLDEYAEFYSTGMQKKLALSALLFLQNDIFILDEPFNGVDIQSNILIVEILERLKAMNKCIIISSHIFSSLEEYCDGIHYLKNGVIEKSATKNEYQSIIEAMKKEAIMDKLDHLNLQ